jgi:hypothetical protein
MAAFIGAGSMKRKIYFLRMIFKNGIHQVNPVEIFSRINSLSYDNDGRYLTLDDGNVWSMFLIIKL